MEGLLCHYLFANGSAQYIFLDVDDEGFGVVNRTHSFCTENNMHICASSNGLLLLSCVTDNIVYYTVLNLFTKHFFTLPHPQTQLTTRRSIRIGLAFDGRGCHYQVVRILSVEGGSSSSSTAEEISSSSSVEIEIFSSETCSWRQHRPMFRLPPELPKLATSPLFSNGAIHWELGGYLLVYFVKNGNCTLIELPNNSQGWSSHSMTFGQCLWESEGRVHYCYTDFRGIHTWDLLKEEDHKYYSSYYPYDCEKFKWKLSHTITHQTLMSQNLDVVFLSIRQRNNRFSEWKPSFISPCGYIEDSQTMFLRLPGAVVSYNLRNRTLKVVCTFNFPEMNFYCCLFLPVVYGLHQGDSQMVNRRSSAVGSGDVINLPITDAVLHEKNTCKEINPS